MTPRGTSTDQAVACHFLQMSSSQKLSLLECSQASDTCPDVAPSAKLHTPGRGLGPTPLPACPTVLTFGVKISESFISRKPPNSTPLGPAGRSNRLGSFLLSVAARQGSIHVPPSAAFVTGGRERVPTSQEPAAPTRTSGPGAGCSPAGTLPATGSPPLRACPSHRRFRQAQPTSPPSRRTQDASRCGRSHLHLLFPCAVPSTRSSTPPATQVRSRGQPSPLFPHCTCCWSGNTSFPLESLMHLSIFLRVHFLPCLAPITVGPDQ